MALTQSARLPGPSWDEEVVPALRKRLQSESRTLARRMSAVSISSVEESSSQHNHYPTDPYAYDRSGTGSASGGNTRRRIPETPRPTPSRTTTSSSADRRVNGTPKPMRSRTYSQSDTPPPNGTASPRMNGNQSKDSLPHPNSPPESRPTRIPKPASVRSRSRAGSTSSHQYGAALNGYTQSPYRSPPTPSSEQSASNLYSVRETAAPSSTVSVNTRQHPVILNEPAPFQPTSTSSIGHYDNEDAPPRPSTESEERPYEHWYRGEISRNGGVGELRVAKRMEMLEIANYGHSSGGMKPNAITEAIIARRRQRAGSFSGLDQRESIYLDEERAREIARVLDEGPLTDLDAESGESALDYYHHGGYDDNEDEGVDLEADDTITRAVDLSTASAPVPISIGRSPTPTRSGIPKPIRNITPTPGRMTRGQSEPPLSTPSRSTPSPSSSRNPPKSKRNQSPAPFSASKKARTEASKATRAKTEAARRQAEKDRRSIARYPSLEAEELGEDAIPTWTQPVPKTGNWDEVVLPTVAKKKGLEGYYEQVDGSSRVRQTQERVEPAPGTFGYDRSKYRPPRDDEEIPMDEFGRPNPPVSEEEEEQRSPPPLSTTPHDEVRVGSGSVHRPQPPPSPVPFSHYAPANGASTLLPTKMEVERRAEQKIEEDGGAGCCKCVIM